MNALSALTNSYFYLREKQGRLPNRPYDPFLVVYRTLTTEHTSYKYCILTIEHAPNYNEIICAGQTWKEKDFARIAWIMICALVESEKQKITRESRENGLNYHDLWLSS